MWKMARRTVKTWTSRKIKKAEITEEAERAEKASETHSLDRSNLLTRAVKLHCCGK